MRNLLYIILFIFLLSATTDNTTSPEAVNAKVKTVYIYNFTKYIDWPQEYKSGNFTIAIVGSNPSLIAELTKMASTKKAGFQDFEVKQLTSISSKDKYHILFISPDTEISVSDISSKLKGKSTLLVTEKTGLAKQWSAINFVVKDNKQKFELNSANAEKYKLKISSNLKSLALPAE
ncbi:MAG: YfiR family protein [Bacteroidetes bacterium]|nr:YfiR family protein [Bacteroidota bacterium]